MTYSDGSLTWQAASICGLVFLIVGLAATAWWIARIRRMSRPQIRTRLNPLFRRDYTVGKDVK